MCPAVTLLGLLSWYPVMLSSHFNSFEDHASVDFFFCWCLIFKSAARAIESQSYSLQWRHNGRHGVSNHHPYDCLLNRLFRRRWKKTPKLRVTGLCAGNSPVTSEFPAQMASNAEMFPFDDFIMFFTNRCHLGNYSSIPKLQRCSRLSLGMDK